MHNRITRYELAYGSSGSNTGDIVYGLNDLTALGSTGLTGVCTDNSGNVYVSDSVEHVILKIDMSRGSGASTPAISIYAGQLGVRGNNGDDTVTAYNALFADPGGLACDNTGNIYVADVGNNQIRKIDSNRNVSLLAGAEDASSGFISGAAFDARFNEPYDVTVDNSGNVFVADSKNNAVRIIKGDIVWTVSGNGVAGDVLGLAGTSQLSKPYGVAADPMGNVYISDSGNFKIKMLTSDFYTHHFSGTGLTGSKIGTAYTSHYQTLKYMDCDDSGKLYVIDFDVDGTSRLLRLGLNGDPGTIVDFPGSQTPFVNSVACFQNQYLFVVESIDTEFESSSSTSSASSVNSSSSSPSSESSSSSSTLVLTSSSSTSSVNSSSSSSSSKSSSSVSSPSSESSSSTQALPSSASSESSSSSGVNLEVTDDQEVTITDPSGHYNVTYTGGEDTSATFIIDGDTFVFGNVGGSFVFDIGGGQEHTFTFIGESVVFATTLPRNFNIVFDGFGSLLFGMDFSNLSSSSSQSSASSLSSQSSSSGSSSLSSQSTLSSLSSTSTP